MRHRKAYVATLVGIAVILVTALLIGGADSSGRESYVSNATSRSANTRESGEAETAEPRRSPVPETTSMVDVNLKATTVVVLDAQTLEPLNGALVSCRSEAHGVREATSGIDGRALLRLPYGTWTTRVTATARSPVTLKWSDVGGVVQVILEPNVVVSGEVRSKGGDQSSVRVEVRFGRTVVGETVAESGAFRCDDLPLPSLRHVRLVPGAMGLIVRATSAAGQSGETQVPLQERVYKYHVAIEMDDVRLGGSLTSSQGWVLSNYWVELESPEGASLRVRADEDGVFRVAGKPGRYGVTIGCGRLDERGVAIGIREIGTETRIEVPQDVLPRTGAIEGRYTGLGSVDGVRILGPPSRDGRLAANGRFYIEDVPEGESCLVFMKGGVEQMRVWVTLRSGESRVLGDVR